MANNFKLTKQKDGTYLISDIETNFMSIVADIFTMVALFLTFFGFYINHRFCGDSILLNLLCFFIIFFGSLPRKEKTLSKEELYDFIEKL